MSMSNPAGRARTIERRAARTAKQLQAAGIGSHLTANGTICHCGPANLYSGPQYVEAAR